MLHVLFYPFLLKTCFKSVGEPLYLLTVHPKLIFRGAPRNALKVLEDQYYQRQYFVNIFPSTLALTLQIHFYSSLSGIILVCALKVIALKSATFSAPETNLETLLCYFSKTWLKTWRKSWWSSLFWWNRSIFQIFIFPAYYIFCYRGKLSSHTWLEKNCVYEARLYFFLWKTSDYLILLKSIIRVLFFSNILTKP